MYLHKFDLQKGSIAKLNKNGHLNEFKLKWKMEVFKMSVSNGTTFDNTILYHIILKLSENVWLNGCLLNSSH